MAAAEVSGSGEQPGIAKAIAVGAIGFVLRTHQFEVLLHTVIGAAEGESVMAEVEHR